MKFFFWSVVLYEHFQSTDFIQIPAAQYEYQLPTV